MRQLLVFLAVVILPISLVGQNKNDTLSISMLGPCVETISSEPPMCILIMKDSEIELDTVERLRINPKHIKKIEVLKSQKDMNVYHSKNGVLLVYPKRRYLDFYKEMFIEER